MILSILLGIVILIVLMLVLLDVWLQFYVGISLKEFISSISLLADIQVHNKHKLIEELITQMINHNFKDKDKLIYLRQVIQSNIDEIDKLPSIILSSKENEIRESLIQSSSKIGLYLYQIS